MVKMIGKKTTVVINSQYVLGKKHCKIMRSSQGKIIIAIPRFQARTSELDAGHCARIATNRKPGDCSLDLTLPILVSSPRPA
jgi:hypothetical protein